LKEREFVEFYGVGGGIKGIYWADDQGRRVYEAVSGRLCGSWKQGTTQTTKNDGRDRTRSRASFLVKREAKL